MVPQRIVLTGESGSGKTSNYLHIMDHLLYIGKNNNINIERLKNGIKLIHSLTHASTPVNGYSTRCVFTTNIKFGSTGKVTGAVFNVYQLEKFRISSVDMSQGNFHIFYYIYDGLQDMNRLSQYHLKPNCQYRYLRLGRNLRVNSNEMNVGRNLMKFQKIWKILEDFEFDEKQMDTIFCIVAAILNIGEIRIGESDAGEAHVINTDSVEKVAELLKIERAKLEWALTNYCLFNKGVAVRKGSTVDEARDARDVLANTLYARVVDYIIAVVNEKLATGAAIFGEKYSIKIFDYFGFECFKANHLSQLLINCFNEQIHYHYLQRIFSWECLDVMEEELQYQSFNYYDNKKTLDQLLGKSEGILSFIDDASKMGQGGSYVLELLQNLDQKSLITVAGRSEFAVAHYTGKVTYNVTEMADKNRDFLPPEITETLRLSHNLIVRSLFTNKLDKTGNLIMNSEKNNEVSKRRYEFHSAKKITRNHYSQIKKMRTFINVFKAFSLEVLRELSIGSGSGGTHFVRCIRSNLKRQPGNFDYQLIKQQIRALAVKETAIARQKGYPHRISFSEFLRRYQFLAFDFDENVEVTKENCRLLLIRLKIEGWDIGKSKVFLKYYNEEFLARLYETQVKKIIKIQSIMRRFLAKKSVPNQVKQKEKKLSKTNKRKSHLMNEDEAAAIIQRAYRESTVRKTYPDFAKDYKVLDEDTCNFVRKFAKRWRRNSLFHVLMRYRAMRFQDLFNFAQQIHLYNIETFYKLQLINETVSLDATDSTANISQWLGDPKPTLTKMPFRLDEIPFYDTSGMCSQLTNLGVSLEKDDSWDLPYRCRELVSSKSTQTRPNSARDEDDLIHLPYSRDPDVPLKELYEIREKRKYGNGKKESREEETEVMCQNIIEKYSDLRKISKIIDNGNENKNFSLKTPPQERSDRVEDDKINSNAKLANEDFDYIKPSALSRPNAKFSNKDFGYTKHSGFNKPKSMNPVDELKKFGLQRNTEDEPPFNFQAMLRKTNYRRDNEYDNSINNKENRKMYNNVMKNNRVNGLIEDDYNGKKVKVQLAPGVVIEGIEVEL